MAPHQHVERPETDLLVRALGPEPCKQDQEEKIANPQDNPQRRDQSYHWGWIPDNPSPFLEVLANAEQEAKHHSACDR